MRREHDLPPDWDDDAPELLSARSPFWTWWRGRIRLPEEFIHPHVSRRLLATLSRELKACSQFVERNGTEFRFHDLEIHRHWLAYSKARTNGVVRFETEAGSAFLIYEVRAWPDAMLALAMFGIPVVGLLLTGTPSPHVFIPVLSLCGIAFALCVFGISVGIVRWVLRRVIRETSRRITRH